VHAIPARADSYPGRTGTCGTSAYLLTAHEGTPPVHQGLRWLLVLSLLATFIVVTPSAVRAATQTVTTTANSGAGSLRAVIAAASSGDTIVFNIAGDGPHTIILTSEQITIDKNLTISGPGAAQLTVARSNEGGPNFRIFQITAGTTVTIDGLTVSNGRADDDEEGGGIYNQGTLNLTSSTISGNSASEGYGGGIYNSGTLNLTSSTISGNSALSLLFPDGGGIYNERGTLTLTSSTISGNSAYRSGGGIYDWLGTLTIINSTISGNTATDGGGGISSLGGTVNLTSSTISGNTASFAGGIYNNQGTLNLTSSTVSGNTASGSGNSGGPGGGIGHFSTLNLTSSIVAGNSGGDISGSIASSTYSLTSGDPKLGPLADNGGLTQTMALLPGSPALNAGGPTCPATDQRGVARPQGPACDIGAYESTIFVVTNTADSGAGSLRQAILDANARVDPDIITFASDVTGTITLESALPTIDKHLTIIGPGAGALAISGNNLYRVFEIAAGTTVTIDGLTISNGRASDGGGIRNSGTLTITSSTINGNTATNYGGGIYNSGTLNLTSSTISDNTAFSGGGIMSYEAILNLISSTVSGNTADVVGGIYNFVGTLNLTSSTISGNSSDVFAGGILNTISGALNLTSSIVAGNIGGNLYGTVSTGANNLIDVDPLLGALTNNGGPTQTMLPSPGSPAIDAGGATCPEFDQRGVARPQGTACDIGAVEVRLPTITVPDDITEAATSPAGTEVDFTVSATDWEGNSTGASCDADSGDLFPLDVTTVTCSTSGEVDHDVSDTFTVTVTLPDAPAINVPDDMLVEATSPDGAVVTFFPTATDWNNDPLTVTCDPASDSTFPLGDTTVDCSATDAFDRTAEDSFTVTVQDTTAPVLSQPDNLSVVATSPSGAVVSYDLPAASDAVDENVSVSCDPPPGSLFPVGTTPVTCSAEDASGNEADPVGFTVTVLGGSQQLSILINNVRTGPGSIMVKSRLQVMLRAADLSLRRGQTSQSCTLLAGFATTVHLFGAARLIPATTAADWRADALRIRAVLGCR